MRDRQPGAPGQYKAIITAAELQKLQSNEQFIITLTRDDQPLVEGTPYNKASVLPDELAALICPDVLDPTPADALRGILNKAAPAGYGLGVANIYALTPIRSHAELDILRGNGWYGWIADLEIAPGSSITGIIRMETSSENYRTQWFTGLSGDRLVRSYIYGQGWTPWKWENPFMLGDAEYATTEFFNGMTVYTKMAVYSPDSFTEQTISLPHGISGLFRGVSVDVLWQYTDTTGTVTRRRFPSIYYNSAEWSGQAFFFGTDHIKFELGSTLLKNIKGSADNVYVILKYVKA